MSFNDYQRQQFDGGQHNVLKVEKKYSVMTIPLDQEVTHSTEKWRMNFPIRSFWVRKVFLNGAESNDFIADIKLNQNDQGDPLPLSRNMNLSYEYKQSGCTFSWPAQPGKSIQVVFAHDSEIDVGLVESEIAAEISLKRISNIATSQVILSGLYSPAMALDANPKRDHAIIVNRRFLAVDLYTPNETNTGLGSRIGRLLRGQSFRWEYSSPLWCEAIGEAYSGQLLKIEALK